MAESIEALPLVRGRCRRPAEPPPRAAPKPAAASDCPRWLRDALARRGLRPSAGRPVHRLLREHDLPEDVEEHEKVPIGTEHDALRRDLAYGIRRRYLDRPDVFVAKDLLVYFDGPQATLATAARLAPDLMVAFGVPKQARRNYPVWEVGKAPDFVLEILAPTVRKKDIEGRPALYRRMGAREYFLFDPTGRLEPRLRGWRFDPDEDAALPLAVPVDGMRGIFSEALGLHLCHTQPWPTTDHHLPGAGKLRWRGPATGALLETADEVAQSLAEQIRRADAAEERAATAERQRAEQAQRADAAERQRAEEAAARRLLEEKVAALESRLR